MSQVAHFMLIEAIDGPISYRWPSGMVTLTPGERVCLPDLRALRLLAKAQGKVRLVGDIAVGDIATWQRADGTVSDGTVIELLMEETRNAWVLVSDEGLFVWVHQSRLLIGS